MKRTIIFLSFLLTMLSTFALESKKVAILEVVDKDNKLSNYQKNMLRDQLAYEVSKLPEFEAYDRTNVDAIMSEHLFQRTGYVSQDQIKELGNMTGAAYILVIEGAISAHDHLFASATILDVVTGQRVVSANENMVSSDKGMKQGCASLAKNIFEELNLAIKEEKAQYQVSKSKKNYMYMGEAMDEKEYAEFLQKNCRNAYKQYMKGTRLTKAGWALFGIGLPVALVGTTGIVMPLIQWDFSDRSSMNRNSPEYQSYWNMADKYMRYGYIILGAGGALFVSSIPIICAGKAKQKKSVSIYNEQCASPSIPPLTFNITAGQNGIGLAMQF